ncbi:PREDICTED: uncharacterized protein LOC105152583 [Acromyrmex echinatior]|uniref:uncharacterized protein LOC105152583 n=1 Tax=Acromyrmex echinatior TaxID=103372 RepID=UPI000580E6F2|nr:PREDICTED: uncharacterized protein LOC105152583 [Acromyrmex echinatior]
MQLEADGVNGAGKPVAELSPMAGGSAVVNRRLMVQDRVTGIHFLVNTGADVSTIPASKRDFAHLSKQVLYAANGTIIPTYGQKLLRLDLGFRRVFQWPFVIAEVDTFIIDSDFLARYNLLPDIRHKRLIDGDTFLKVNAQLICRTVPKLTAFADDCPFKEMLKEFPEITRASVTHKQAAHGVEHVNKTTGPPVSNKARRPKNVRERTRARALIVKFLK